jgi:hypothetical protein
LFVDIPGATSTTYSFTTSAGQSGNLYRAVFTNSQGHVITSAASLTVTVAPTVKTNPTSQTIVAGHAVTFTAAGTGTPAPTVQWQVSTNHGGLFVDIPGATSTTYSFTTSTGQSGNLYRAVFTNSAGFVLTSAATLTVVVAPVVTTNPANQTIAAGQMVTFSAAASGSPAPTVQWQVSTNHGSTFVNIPGATSINYSFTVASGQNGNLYRAVFTNSAGSAISSAAKLTVGVSPFKQATDKAVSQFVTRRRRKCGSGVDALQAAVSMRCRQRCRCAASGMSMRRRRGADAPRAADADH